MGRLFYVAVLILNRRIDTASQSQTHSIPRCATACPHESPASWRVLLLARCDINMSLRARGSNSSPRRRTYFLG